MKIAFLQISNDLHCICSTLQYVLQMSTVLLETDLKGVQSCCTYTFFLGDSSGVLCDCLFQFRNCLGIVLMHMVFQVIPKVEVWGFQVRPMQRPLRISASTDQCSRESRTEPLQGHIGCTGSSPIWLEPLTISPEHGRTSHSVLTAQSSPVLLRDLDVPLLCYGEQLLILIFKPAWSNDAMFWHCYQCYALL